MSKHHPGQKNKQTPGVKFVDFWQFIATQLGDARLKVNPDALTIHQFMHTGSDHKEYLRDAIIQSYKRSQCSHLNASIDVNHVLDILGETAYELQGKHCDDLLDIELLEEIAWHLSQRFAKYIVYQPAKVIRDAAQADSTNHHGKIVSMPKIKIRRANARL